MGHRAWPGRAGATVLLTTQYLDEADALADRIAVIDRGNLVAEGTPSELKSSIGDQVLRLDIPDTADLRRAESLIQDITGEVPDGSSTGTLTVALSEVTIAADIVAACRDAGIALRGFAVDRPDLNEVFLALTGHTHTADRADVA